MQSSSCVIVDLQRRELDQAEVEAALHELTSGGCEALNLLGYELKPDSDKALARNKLVEAANACKSLRYLRCTAAIAPSAASRIIEAAAGPASVLESLQVKLAGCFDAWKQLSRLIMTTKTLRRLHVEMKECVPMDKAMCELLSRSIAMNSSLEDLRFGSGWDCDEQIVLFHRGASLKAFLKGMSGNCSLRVLHVMGFGKVAEIYDWPHALGALNANRSLCEVMVGAEEDTDGAENQLDHDGTTEDDPVDCDRPWPGVVTIALENCLDKCMLMRSASVCCDLDVVAEVCSPGSQKSKPGHCSRLVNEVIGLRLAAGFDTIGSEYPDASPAEVREAARLVTEALRRARSGKIVPGLLAVPAADVDVEVDDEAFGASVGNPAFQTLCGLCNWIQDELVARLRPHSDDAAIGGPLPSTIAGQTAVDHYGGRETAAQRQERALLRAMCVAGALAREGALQELLDEAGSDRCRGSKLEPRAGALLEARSRLRAYDVLAYRRATEAHSDAACVFRAARDGHPLELQKRLVLGKLAGGLTVGGVLEGAGHMGPLEAALLQGHERCADQLRACGVRDPSPGMLTLAQEALRLRHGST